MVTGVLAMAVFEAFGAGSDSAASESMGGVGVGVFPSKFSSSRCVAHFVLPNFLGPPDV